MDEVDNLDILKNIYLTGIETYDLRYPTSVTKEGSDAMHTSGNYSAAYIIMHCASESGEIETVLPEGHAHAFTIGKGNDMVVGTIKILFPTIQGLSLYYILHNFGKIWRELTSDPQLRWVGPEKGILHLATAVIVNSVWDLFSKIFNKPVWKFISDLDPEILVNCLDFRYVEDELTREEALEMLKQGQVDKQKREQYILQNGYPAYSSACGWSGYSEEHVNQLIQKMKTQYGFNVFKAKVGLGLQQDYRRIKFFRETIGWENILMVDANQVWGVDEAIQNMKSLAEFKPIWIEEPTSPDDILGHAKINAALSPYNIGVATGEMIQNRTIHKQYFQTNGYKYVQLDCARLGGINEVLVVLLLAKKFKKPVCNHCGGVGLSQYGVHASIIDYLIVSGNLEERYCEWTETCHQYFVTPPTISHGAYDCPTKSGWSLEFFKSSIADYLYPCGTYWIKSLGSMEINQEISSEENSKVLEIFNPQKQNGFVDWKNIPKLAQTYEANSINAVLLNYEVSKWNILSFEERKNLIEFWVTTPQFRKKKLELILNVTSHNPILTIQLILHGLSFGIQHFSLQPANNLNTNDCFALYLNELMEKLPHIKYILYLTEKNLQIIEDLYMNKFSSISGIIANFKETVEITNYCKNKKFRPDLL